MIKKFGEFLNENYQPLFEANSVQEAAWRTEVQENVTCDIFNNYLKNEDITENNYTTVLLTFIENQRDKYFKEDVNNNAEQIAKNKIFNEMIDEEDGFGWRKSFFYQMLTLKDWATQEKSDIKLEEYTFVRHGIDNIIGRRVEEYTKKAGKGISHFKKDNYQKADIYAYKNDIIDTENKFNSINDIEAEQALWSDEITSPQPTFFGISLKKLAGKGSPKIINIANNKSIQISDAKFILPKPDAKSGYLEFYLNNVKRKFQIAAKDNTVKIELAGSGTRDGNVKIAYNILTKDIKNNLTQQDINNNSMLLKKNSGGELYDENYYNKHRNVIYAMCNMLKVAENNYNNDLNEMTKTLYLAAKGYKHDLYVTIPYLYLGA